MSSVITGIPFSSSSPWNSVIPGAATFSSIPGITSLATGLSTWLVPNADSLPIYTATSSDPLEPILYSPDAWSDVASGAWLRSGNSAAVEAQILADSSPVFPFSGNPYSSQSTTSWALPANYDKLQNPASGPEMVNLPANAIPEMGSDGQMAVYEPNGMVLEIDSGIRLSTGQIVALTYHLTDPSGLGTGAENGVTASMIPVYAGVITGSDVASGQIDHAMKIVVPATLLNASFEYPALAFDRDATTNSPAYSGTLPMGAHIALPENLNIASLGLQSDLGKMIAVAAQDYGFFIADRGGSGITVEAQGNSGNALLDNWTQAESDDLAKILHAAQEVSNDPNDVPTAAQPSPSPSPAPAPAPSPAPTPASSPAPTPAPSPAPTPAPSHAPTPTPAPAPTPAPSVTTTPANGGTFGTGPDTLVLNVSEDAYKGNAKFTVSVDGKAVGGTLTATASHAADASQNFTFDGSFGDGPHTVAVTFLNDAYGGNAATDRNLYVNGVDFDGHQYAVTAALYNSGAVATFAVAGPSPSTTPTPSAAYNPVIATPDAHAPPIETRDYVAPAASGIAHGTAGADDIFATGAHQTLIGGGGDDVFEIGTHTDAKVVVGSFGTTTVTTWAQHYTLAAGVNDLTLEGNYWHNVTGNGLANYFTGSDGNDTINGGGGNSTFAVGTGANTITGGGKHDLFVFSNAADHDNVITDFHAGQDMLDLRAMMHDAGYTGSDPVADHVLQLSQHGADTSIALVVNGTTHNVVTLEGVTASSLHAGQDYLWH